MAAVTTPSTTTTDIPSESDSHYNHEHKHNAMKPSLPDTPPNEPTSSRVSSLCPHCGVDTYGHIFPEDAQDRITELESQVRILTVKASTAADKLATYESELQKLKTSAPNPPSSPPSATTPTRPSTATAYKEQEPLPPVPVAGESGTLYQKRPSVISLGDSEKRPSISASAISAGLGRFPSFRLGRKSSPALNAVAVGSGTQSAPSTPPLTAVSIGPSMKEIALAAELEAEKNARKEAEKKIGAMSTEIEELSTSLFEQANDMVADERRARAKLETHVGTLEGKIKELERKDEDKKRRLDRLDEGLKRVERIRGLLGRRGEFG